MRTAIRKFLKKLFYTMYNKPLPPASTYEKMVIRNLIKKFESLSNVTVSGKAKTTWEVNQQRLTDLILHDDVRSFLRWDVIQNTMFVSNVPYVRKELHYLKRSGSWESRWSSVIEEDHVGRPTPFVYYPRSSGNRIHHAYHLAVFEDATGIPINTFDVIQEFGGGYGGMCRLVHRLGFCGVYVIFDLAPFTALQKYYLKTVGIDVYSTPLCGLEGFTAVCISDMKELEKFLAQSIKPVSNSLFMATWSLSEPPLELRDVLFPMLKNFRCFLIAYQSIFSGIDNDLYFNESVKHTSGIQWWYWEIKHLPGNHYLIGKRRE